MPVTAPERAAGRLFKAQMEEWLYNRPEPDIWVPALIRHYRHICPKYRDGTGVSFDIAEVYLTSPPYPEFGVPEGRFAFIFHEGRCSRCGLTARSNQQNRVVGVPERPPSGRAKPSPIRP